MNDSKQRDSSHQAPSPAEPKTEPTYLYVPFAEKDQARKLGAHWDPKGRAWFVPPGIPTAPFERWRYLPPIAQHPLYLDLHQRDLDPDELLHVANVRPPVTVVLMPFECWRCHGDAPAFYGVADQGGFLFTDPLYRPETIEEIHTFAKQQKLVSLGTIKPRFSKGLDRLTLSQGCPRCDSLFGSHFLHQDALSHFTGLSSNYPHQFDLDQWPPDSLHDYLNERGL